MKKDTDLELMRIAMEKQIKSNFKVPFWKRVRDVVENIFVFILIMLLLFILIFLLITLIENPISLTIICVTILGVIILINK